ncbi:hypothetical protein KTH05_11405 [Acinetobacter lactucae]|uniref:hypothetical protein n=1 Tax=Acinetobacter lactucae TaxID=1785128 RepID=UPI0021CD5850|nr:hypothetical protein [Acinetobacter lactucae]MCU4348356.1 hypothetical protein [Acinetobacter lactucae]
MLSLHFNKQVFINTLNSKDSVVYGVTPLALMLTLLFQGMIKGNLKPEYFMYAMVVSFIFCVWAFVDHKMRKLAKRRLNQQNLNT